MSGGLLCAVGGILYPSNIGTYDMSFASIVNLNAAAARLAIMGQVNWVGGGTKDLRKIHWRTGTVTNGTGTTTVRIAVEDVAASAGNVGIPDGTIDQSVTFDITTLTSDSWQTHTLIADRTGVVQGTRLAVAWDFSAFGTSPSLGITGFPATFFNNASTNRALDYAANSTDSGATWSVLSTRPCIVLEASDGTFGYFTGMPVLKSANSHAFASGSNPKGHGMYFVAPFSFDGVGIRMTLTPAATGAFDIEVYEDGSLISSTSVDTTKLASPTARVAESFLFDSVVSFVKDSVYYVLVKATGAGNVTIYSFDVNSAGIMDCLPGKSTFQYATLSSTDVLSSATTTRRPVMELLVGSITAGGGGTFNLGFGGGING